MRTGGDRQASLYMGVSQGPSTVYALNVVVSSHRRSQSGRQRIANKSPLMLCWLSSDILGVGFHPISSSRTYLSLTLLPVSNSSSWR